MDGASAGPQTKTWLIRVAANEAQIRCAYQRHKKQILRFTVQLEIMYEAKWTPGRSL